MGWKFYGLDSLPAQYDIVWCKWPRPADKLTPGPWTRPVLVREVMVFEHTPTKVRYGALVVSYGTGTFDSVARAEWDLIIDDWAEIKAAGLHKPTMFSLDSGFKRRLPWCEEYFLSPEYVKSVGVITGRLSPQQIARLHERLERRRSAVEKKGDAVP
jgi:hypothetical protein